MARVFQIKRGLKANLPVLAQGEFAMTTDSGAEVLWLGNGSENLKIPLNPTAADVGALAQDGSNAMTGDLTVKNAATSVKGVKIRSTGADNGAIFGAFADANDITSKRAQIKVRHSLDDLSDVLQLVIGTSAAEPKYYSVHHAGNKPSGSYTGNGSEAERTIDTGGIGDCLLLYTTNYFGFATPSGGILWQKSTGEATVFNSTAVKYRAGILTLAIAAIPNTNKATYNYRCL